MITLLLAKPLLNHVTTTYQDGHLQFLPHVMQRPDVGPRHVRDGSKTLPFGRWLDRLGCQL